VLTSLTDPITRIAVETAFEAIVDAGKFGVKCLIELLEESGSTTPERWSDLAVSILYRRNSLFQALIRL